MKKVVLKISGQKALMESIDLNAVIAQDLSRISKKYPATFGKAEETGSYANLLETKAFDATATTIKLKCKDGAKISMDINLPWNQCQAEFDKISGTPEIDILLAGVVG